MLDLTINEVQVAGANAADEFIEIYNAASCSAPFTPYKLVYRSAQGTTDSTTIYDGTVAVPANGYLLLAHHKFTGSGTVAARFGTTASGDSGLLAGAGGKLAIKEDSGAVVDSMGYGTASGAYVNGTKAAAPGDGQSVARTPDGQSTGNDSADFVVGTPTPGTTND